MGNKSIEELRREAEALKRFLDRAKSPIDSSPEGIHAAQKYVDDTTEAITNYVNLFSAFNTRHGQARENPRLFKNKEWQGETRLVLAALVVKVNEFPLEFPRGCFTIFFELQDIPRLTLEFSKRYFGFLNDNKQSSLNEAGTYIEKIFTSIDKTAVAVEKVIEQIEKLSE